MSFLTLMQDAADEIGLPRPSSIIGSLDQNARQLLALSNREGRELAKAADWTGLQFEHTITTAAGQPDYPLPDDYARVLPDTEWDESQQWPLHGPISPQGWQVLKTSVLGAGQVGKRYRIYRLASSTVRRFWIDPTPGTAGETLSFIYISKHWCANAAGDTTQAGWAADDDQLLIEDADLMRLGTIVRYKRAKSLEFASEAAEYEDLLARAKAQDRPAKTIRLAGRRTNHLLDRGNVPDTFPIS